MIDNAAQPRAVRVCAHPPRVSKHNYLHIILELLLGPPKAYIC